MYLRLNPYDEILQGIRVSLRIDEGIIKITGRKGSGKTALCNRLYEDLQADDHPSILFPEPPSSAIALQQAIVDRLHLDSGGNFTRVLNAWLQARNADEKPLVLIFDDAQGVDAPTFSAVRMLCNIQNGTRALVRVVLCGNEELDARIASPALRAVTQFISQSFTLPYLTREQVRDFRQAWCMQAGRDMKALDERALERLFHDTKGQPGLLYARCEQESAGLEPVATPKPEIAVVDAPPATHRDGKPVRRLPALAIAVVLLLAGGAAAYLYLAPSIPQVTEASARSEADASPALAAVPTAPADASPARADMPASPADAPIAEPAPVVVAVDAPPETDTAVALTISEAGDASSGIAAAVEVPPEALVADAPPEAAIADAPAEVAVETGPAVPAVEASPPEAPLPGPEPAPVEDFITSWIASWQARDVESYLAHYHRDFAPMQGTRAGWEEQRRRVIANAGDIVISADAPQSNAEAQDGMRVVRFWLNYRAAAYADRTLKELVLARAGDTWRIRAERNLRTEPQ